MILIILHYRFNSCYAKIYTNGKNNLMVKISVCDIEDVGSNPSFYPFFNHSYNNLTPLKLFIKNFC
jgi:hypothetical protein